MNEIAIKYIENQRRNGATLEQIGNEFNLTRERIRQILVKHCGTSNLRKFLTTAELAEVTSLSTYTINKYRRVGEIQPVTNNHKKALWDSSAILQVLQIRTCPLCGQRLPSGRAKYCSDKCLEKSQAESHKRAMWRRLYKKQGKSIPPSLAYK